MQMKYGIASCAIALALTLNAAEATACRVFQQHYPFFHDTAPASEVADFVAEVEIVRTYRIADNGHGSDAWEAKVIKLIRGNPDIAKVMITQWVISSCDQGATVGARGIVAGNAVSHVEDETIVIILFRDR